MRAGVFHVASSGTSHSHSIFHTKWTIHDADRGIVSMSRPCEHHELRDGKVASIDDYVVAAFNSLDYCVVQWKSKIDTVRT